MLAPPPRRRRPFRASLALLLTTACANDPELRPPEESSRHIRVPVAAHARTLEICAPNGRVTLTAGVAPTCEVLVQARAGSRREASRVADNVVLQPDPTPDDDTCAVAWAPKDGVDMDHVNLSITVSAPPSLAVRVLTRKAAVVVHGYAGQLHIDTDCGEVAARLAGGSAEIRSHSGGVRLSGDFDRADVQAVESSVQVVLPATRHPAVEVRTDHGDVLLEVPPDSRVDFAARVRNPHSVPCELAAQWSEYGLDAGDRWKSFRGAIGAATHASLQRSQVSVTTENGRVALRSLPRN